MRRSFASVNYESKCFNCEPKCHRPARRMSLQSGQRFAENSMVLLKSWRRQVSSVATTCKGLRVFLYGELIVYLAYCFSLDQEIASSRAQFEVKVKGVLYFMVHGLQVIMVMWFRKSPVFYLPYGWFGPAGRLLSMPFAPKGNVLLCSYLFQLLFKLQSDNFYFIQKGPSALLSGSLHADVYARH